MLLREFEDQNPLRVKLTGILSQLRSRAKDTGANEPYSLDALINKLHDADIHLDAEELRDISEEPPLNNLLTIKGSKVLWKGLDSDTEEIDQKKKDDTLDKMAKRASKKPEL